jgi:spore coat polysaccharide biosynthesis protein SpsF
MVAGQRDNLKIGAIIQARMRSSRLPGKILMPLPYPHGKPLLSWVVEGARLSGYVTNIIIATSSGHENDCLEKFSSDSNVALVRGSEEDVLSRFIQATIQHNLDLVVRLTGDNPIVDAKVLDETIKHHLEAGNDYTKTSGLPVGTNFEIVSAKSLLSLSDHNMTGDDKEHVTLFLRNSEIFKKSDLPILHEDFSAVRLTVDYPSDFAALSILLSFAKDNIADLSFAKKIRLTHPWIFEINANNWQRPQFQTSREEIQSAISSLETNGMNHAAAILKKHGIS